MLSNNKVHIRRMLVSDVDAVHQIEIDTFTIPWSRDSFLNEMTINRCSRYLVVMVNECIIGYAGMWIVLDEAHITNIAISKPSRTKGYGRMLTCALLQYAANLYATHATLEVRKSNFTAINLYTSLGFINVGVRKRYYEDNGEDALLMALTCLPKPDNQFVEFETVFEE